MKKSLDELARNLASGMSRRKAIWQFVGGLGVVAALTGRKAYADGVCEGFCEEQAEIFRNLCLQASKRCPSGRCAEFTLIHLLEVGVNGGPFICVRVNEV